MREEIFTVRSNRPLNDRVFEMILSGNAAGFSRPGQFVEIRIDGCFLRRPISVCDREDDSLTLIYKTVGVGTERLSAAKPGTELSLLLPLGNGFDCEKSGPDPLVIGGGVGIPPLYGLCRELISKGIKPRAILGFNTKNEAFYIDRFLSLGVPAAVTTADGTLGVRGFVTDVMKETDYSFYYACGPAPMFRAIERIAKTSGEYSFEERMGCGFGACMGCSIMTKNGARRVCKDGPVFAREEIRWED